LTRHPGRRCCGDGPGSNLDGPHRGPSSEYSLDIEHRLLLALAIAGIARRVRWGRRLAVGLQCLLPLAGFGAVMPPQKGVPVSREMPPVEAAMIGAAVLIGFALVCLHLLSLWKKDFRNDWI
jgi:hypothetical protein